MKQLFIILNCFFIVLTGYFCVDILYKRVLPRSSIAAKSVKLDKRRNLGKKTLKQPRQSKNMNTVIAKRNLFNVDEDGVAKPSSVEPETQNLERTRLNLVLWGTVTGQDEKFAVIEDKTARQQSLYLIGDTVQGAKIKQILRHKVVLFYQGKDQILEMNEESKRAPQAKTPRMPAFKPSIMPSVAKQNAASIPKTLDDLMRQIKFRPHYEDGELNGAIIYGIRPSSVFRKVGLRNGDIIQQVNGTPLSSSEDAGVLFEEIINSEQSKLTLKRRGKVEELVISLNGEDSENE